MTPFSQEIHKCYRSLMLHRSRSILSTLGILFGVAAMIAMLSIGEGAKRETLEQIENLGLQTIIVRQSDLSDEQHHKAREKRSRGLTMDDAQALLSRIPSIAKVAPVRVVEGNIGGVTADISPEILAVSKEYQQIKRISLSEGRFVADGDVQYRQLVCVLGADIARSLGYSGRVGQQVRIGDQQFLVVGVLSERKLSDNKQALPINARDLNKVVFIPLGSDKSFAQKQSLKSNLLSEIIVQVQQNKDITITSHLVSRVLEVNHAGVDDYQIVVPHELMHQAYRTQKTFNLVLGSIAAISLLVGGIGIMNIMLANVSERTREIGIRRAVGATRRHIAIQFLTETLLLSLTGAIAGVISGVGITLVISLLAGWKTVVTVWALALAIIMAGGVGVAAGLYPAWRAANMDPIAALRKE